MLHRLYSTEETLNGKRPNRFRFTLGCSTQFVSMFKPARYFSSSSRKLSAIFIELINHYNRQSMQVTRQNTNTGKTSLPSLLLLKCFGVCCCAAATCWTHWAVFQELELKQASEPRSGSHLSPSATLAKEGEDKNWVFA